MSNKYYLLTYLLTKDVVFTDTCQQDYTITTQPISTKFSGKVADGKRKKRPDFGGSHITLGLSSGQIIPVSLLTICGIMASQLSVSFWIGALSWPFSR